MITKKFFLNILIVFLFSSQFSSSLFSAAPRFPDDDEYAMGTRHGGTEAEAVGNYVIITNNTPFNLQISVKKGGTFVRENGVPRRTSDEIPEQLFFGCFPSGTSITVDRRKFDILTLRNWFYKPGVSEDKAKEFYEDNKRKSASFLLDKQNLAGLRTVVIQCAEDRSKLMCCMGYDFTQSPVCAICHDGYSHENDVLVLDCGHEYHEKCVRQWMRSKTTCPFCRKDINSTLRRRGISSDRVLCSRTTIKGMHW